MKIKLPSSLLVTALTSVLAVSAAQAAEWKYESGVDKMTSKTTHDALLISDNMLRFDFPYGGENYGQITVRSRPGEGSRVLLLIAKGQIMCSSYECDVFVRFDDAAPVRFGGDHPADNSSNVVFLTRSAAFIARAKTAKKILVSFTAYRQGTQILEFGMSEPLKWPLQKTK